MKNIYFIILLVFFNSIIMTIHTKRPKAISCQMNSECEELGVLAYNIASKYDFLSKTKTNNKWVCHNFKIVGGKHFKLCVIKKMIRKNHKKNNNADEIHIIKQNKYILEEKPNEKIIRFNADVVGFDFTSVPNSLESFNATNNTLPITQNDEEEEEEEWLEEDDYLDNAFFS